ncbi:hypothetical protein ABZ814_22740 [Micromonospora musae]|uniref:hypothetical protein n=1 Tax=Micromonospora musae TaxID=1894970 RepID=UPI00340E3119
MTALLRRRRLPADPPTHTGPGCCTDCWAVPGEHHDFACAASTPTRRKRGKR